MTRRSGGHREPKRGKGYVSFLFETRRTVTSVMRRFLTPYLENRVYTVRHGIAAGLKRRGGVGFIRRPLSKEETFVQRLDLHRRVAYDIGAYQGEYTLFLARAVGPKGHVVVFEPNLQSYGRILENIELNGFENVRVFNAAVGARSGKATLTFRQSEFAMGSLEENLAREIAPKNDAQSVEVRVETLDGLIERERLPEPDFVKIDVEGLEFKVLTGMAKTVARCKPALFIEIHGAGMDRKAENAQQVVDFLVSRDYSVYHVESDTVINRPNATAAREGHIWCRTPESVISAK